MRMFLLASPFIAGAIFWTGFSAAQAIILHRPFVRCMVTTNDLSCP